MAVYFISDLHFSHKNMAIWRGFKDAEEMDAYIIIEKWNRVVSKRDKVFVLGDKYINVCAENVNYTSGFLKNW